MVRTATEADTEPISAALARAFDDDPIATWCLPSDRRRQRQLRRFYRGRLRTLVPDELVFRDDEGLGAALWAAPDRWHVPFSELARTATFNRRTPLILAGFSRVDRVHPREPHYYLAVLGVVPEGQGRGVGGRLLAPMLERCDTEGVPAYLESSKERNLAFYARHGFRLTGDLTFPRGPRLWTMWRDPR